MKGHLLTCITLFLVLGCQHQRHKNCDVTTFEEHIAKAGVLEYQHIKFFDNKFNSSIFNDTSNVTIFKLDDYQTGFHIQRNEYEWLYSNQTLTELNHLKKTRSIDRLRDIHDTPLWDKNLLSLLDTLSTKECESTLSDNKFYQYFSNKYFSTSTTDSNKALITVLEYTFPSDGADHLEHKEIIIRNSDTLQVQTHWYSNITTSSNKSLAAFENILNEYTYSTQDNEEDLPFGSKPVQEGDRLTKNVFKDIENNMVQIINNEKKYSLVIFSFIGCTPCEIALRKLEEDKFDLKDEVSLYYSSFQNNNEAVKKYLEDKTIFKSAFGKQSKMIDEFRLPVSPTFVLIDSKGTIKKIIEGFDNSVLPTLKEVIYTKTSI